MSESLKKVFSEEISVKSGITQRKNLKRVRSSSGIRLRDRRQNSWRSKYITKYLIFIGDSKKCSRKFQFLSISKPCSRFGKRYVSFWNSSSGLNIILEGSRLVKVPIHLS